MAEDQRIVASALKPIVTSITISDAFGFESAVE